MLSPYIKLNDNCLLCQRLLLGKKDEDFFLDEGVNMYVFKSSFDEKWPGSLMAVYKRHIFEQSQIRSADLSDTQKSLISLERALMRVTSCSRINFVKFGNVVHHLHWHIIPRYKTELYKDKSPWELGHFSKAELYQENIAIHQSPFLNRTLEFKKAIQFEWHHKESGYFGCALFLRPKHIENKANFLKLKVQDILSQVRKEPGNWECLLMKRNYLDYAWDCVGGNSNPNEFPEQTMQREVKEELGWVIKESVEVCRQWKNGSLKGFVFLAIPTQKDYLLDNPPRLPCDEVQEVKYFNLLEILEGSNFAESVKGRIKAFLDNRPDFFSIDP